MKRWQTPWGYDRNQAEFDRQGSLVIILIGWLVRLLAYLPMLLISYAIAKHFMEASATRIKCALLTAVFTLLQLALVKAAKCWTHELRSRGNWWGRVIYVLLLVYRYVVTAFVMYELCR